MSEGKSLEAASAAVSKAKGKGAWYFTYTRECPICGRGDTTRERRHDEKPEFVGDRYEFVHYWDGCNA